MKNENVQEMPMEDWLRGCVYHDGRSGYVTLPCDRILEIANYIQMTRTGLTEGFIGLRGDDTDEADTVEVVRCKNCKHAYKRKPINKTAVLCELFVAGMKDNDFCSHGERSEEEHEALDMAIEALEQVTGKLNNHDDSLLTADSEICKEQKSKLDLISRAEAIEAIEIVDWYHQNSNKDMVSGANDDEHQAWYKADDVYKALEAIPSADRPRGEWVEETSWKYKKGGRNSDMKEILGTEWMTMIRQRCSECNMVTMVDDSILYKYCPHCGAVMRSE